jgi:hypothetical protein
MTLTLVVSFLTLITITAMGLLVFSGWRKVQPIHVKREEVRDAPSDMSQ